MKYSFVISGRLSKIGYLLEVLIAALTTIVFFYLSQSLSADLQMSQLVITQISTTLIVVTVVSIIANMDGRYLYGFKVIDVIFAKNGAIGFWLRFFILATLLFVNIACLILNVDRTIIMTTFILSLYCLLALAYRISSFFLNQIQTRKRLLYFYYKKNRLQMRKSGLMDKTSCYWT